MDAQQAVAKVDQVLETPRQVLDDTVRAKLEEFGAALKKDKKWQWLLTFSTILILGYEAWSLSPLGPSMGDTYSEKTRLVADQHIWIYPIGGAFVGIFLMVSLTATSLRPWIRLCLLGWVATFSHIFWWFTWPTK